MRMTNPLGFIIEEKLSGQKYTLEQIDFFLWLLVCLHQFLTISHQLQGADVLASSIRHHGLV